jgi:hypothetical protein
MGVTRYRVTQVVTLAAVLIISGQAWITGVNQYMLDPDDRRPSGYRLSDTWPRLREAPRAFGAVALSLDAKMAIKYPPHDILSLPETDFNNFALTLA